MQELIHRVVRRSSALLLVLAVFAPAPASADRAAILAEATTVEGPVRVLLQAAEDGSESFRLVRGPASTLPSPEIEYDGFLASATLVTDAAGRLDHMLWIEGPARRETRVRAARWTGLDWSPPVTVDGFGPGSRTSVDAVPLTSGEILAVWSAHDGSDDEIRWSLGDAAGWSPPRDLTFDWYPDVTPVLATADDAAYVAWSSYDGSDYRLELAHWNGQGFDDVSVISGLGVTLPRFQATESGELILTWRQAEPGGWVVAQMSPGGDILRSALAPLHTPDGVAGRPVVRSVTADGAELASGALPWRTFLTRP